MWTYIPPPTPSSEMWALTPRALGFPSGLAEGQMVPAAHRALEPESHTPSHERVLSQALLLCRPRLRSHPCPSLVPFLPSTTRPPVSLPNLTPCPALPEPCPHEVSAECLPGSAEHRPHSQDPHKPGPTPPGGNPLLIPAPPRAPPPNTPQLTCLSHSSPHPAHGPATVP